jgi:limonene-1,2-epoxide hydrolase
MRLRKEFNMKTHRVLCIPMIELVIVTLILLAAGGAAILITVAWPLIRVPSDQAPSRADPCEVVNDFHAAINNNNVDEVLTLFANSATITDNNSLISGRDQIRNWVLYSKQMTGLHLRMFHSEMDGKTIIWLDKAQNGPEGQNRYYILRWDAVIVQGKIQSLVVRARYMPDRK